MRIRTPSDLGALIRDRRQLQGLDQEQLAKKVGVSRVWINQMEHGKAKANLDLVLRTLKALGVTLEVDPAPSSASDETSDIARVIEEARNRR